MKETTRQFVLLIGVLTLLTSSLVVINSTRADEAPEDTTRQVNTTTPNESTQQELDKKGTSDSLVAQSINGYQAMYRDIKVTLNDLLGINTTEGS